MTGAVRDVHRDDGIVRGARLSDDGVYRYELTRRWSLAPLDVWIMLNPSKADAEVDDRTIGRCMGFSRYWGAGGIRVVNLFALRATDPAELARHPDPIGPKNDAAVSLAVTVSRPGGGRVLAAWGSHAMAAHRGRHVRDLIGGPLLCLGTTRAGHPRHPLYVPGETEPVPWRPAP